MCSMNFDFELLSSLNPRPSGVTDSKRRDSTGAEDEPDAEQPTCRYSPTVLIGDWFERRASYTPPPDQWSTVYDDTYTCKINNNRRKDRLALAGNKQKGERGLGKEFLIDHYGDAFHGNYTTTNDLFFRVRPSKLCGPQERKYFSRLNMWLPQVDLTKNYGNLTKFGLTEAINYEMYLKALMDAPGTIQRSDFKKPELSYLKSLKRIPRPQGDKNEPFLCHLDIDPNLPFKPHFIKAKS